MSAAASILEALKGIDPTTFAVPLHGSQVKFVFTENYTTPKGVFVKKGLITNGTFVKGNTEVDAPNTFYTKVGNETLVFSSGGKVLQKPPVEIYETSMPMLSENPNFVFIRDIKLSGMPNVPSGVIVTQQMRYVEAKKGDKIFGVLSNGVSKKGDKGVLSNGPEGQFIRGVFGGLKVQVPIDAVEPIKSTAPSVPDQATNKMLAAPSSAYNLKEAATWALGFSALLVFLKWADII